MGIRLLLITSKPNETITSPHRGREWIESNITESMMKESTEYYYRLTNGGNPEDTREGKGNYRVITLAIGVWLKSISLNGMIQIKIGRDEKLAVRVSESDEDDFAKMLNEVLGAAEGDGVDNEVEITPESSHTDKNAFVVGLLIENEIHEAGKVEVTLEGKDVNHG